MTQKIVIKVHMTCEKCRSKAMKIVAATSGVQSVGISGKDRDQLEVVGEGVDSTCLTVKLRKKVGPAHIVQVGEVKKEEPKPEEPKPKEPTAPIVCPQQWYPRYSQPAIIYECPPSYHNSDPCSIM